MGKLVIMIIALAKPIAGNIDYNNLYTYNIITINTLKQDPSIYKLATRLNISIMGDVLHRYIICRTSK